MVISPKKTHIQVFSTRKPMPLHQRASSPRLTKQSII